MRERYIFICIYIYNECNECNECPPWTQTVLVQLCSMVWNFMRFFPPSHTFVWDTTVPALIRVTMQFIIREVATGFPLYHLWLSSRYSVRFAFALHPIFLHSSVCIRASTSETSVHVVSPMLRWWIFHHRYLQRFNGHRAVVLVAISTSALIGLAVAIPTWWMNNFWCAVASTIFHWSYLFIVILYALFFCFYVFPLRWILRI